MFTEKEMKYVKGVKYTTSPFAAWFMGVASGLAVVSSFAILLLVYKHCQKHEISFGNIINLFISEPDIDAVYTGAEVYALYNTQIAFFVFAAGIVCIIMTVTIQKHHRMFLRMWERFSKNAKKGEDENITKG